MPKDSRRKKQIRQHAARKRERYMRARRNVTPPPQEGGAPPISTPLASDHPMMALAAAPVGLEDVHRLQRALEPRGWTVPSFSKDCVDAHGMAVATDIVWELTTAFGGVDLDDDEDIAPKKPTVCLNGNTILLSLAGNWGGCREHETTLLRSLWTRDDLAKLPEMLAIVEEDSVDLDPGPYIACLLDGPCAKRARRRQELADPFAG